MCKCIRVCVCVCVGACVHVYIYIYIYIYCHPQTDCFVLSELFSVARHVERLKLGLKPIQLYVRLSLRPLGQQAYHVWLRELLRYLCSNSSIRLFTFLYPIGYPSAQFFRRALHYASGGQKVIQTLYSDILLQKLAYNYINSYMCMHAYVFVYIYIYMNEF